VGVTYTKPGGTAGIEFMTCPSITFVLLGWVFFLSQKKCLLARAFLAIGFLHEGQEYVVNKTKM